MTTPSALDVARRALELCDEHPDRTADCSYLRYDIDDEVTGTNCIFGTALVDLGVDPDWLRTKEYTAITAVLSDLTGEELPLFCGLATAQTHQDGGEPWGHESVRGPIAQYIKENS